MSKNAAVLLFFLILLTAACLVFVKPVASFDDVTEKSWTTKTPMHEARAFLGVAAVNGKIYAIGGDNGSYMGNVGNAWGHTNSVVNAIEEYDPANDAWIFKTPMPTARAGLTAAVYKNRIYCIGGWTEDYSSTNVTEVYDPTTDTWETKAPIPKTDALLTANVVNGKIYVLPLWTTGIFEAYDPETDSWSFRTAPPYEITGFTSAVIGNKICFEGAQMTNGTFKGSIQTYNTATDRWSLLSTFPSRFGLYGSGGKTSGLLAPESVYFFMNNITDIYDASNDSWSTGSPMPTIRYCTGAAVVNDTFYVIGGRSGQWGYFTDMRADASNEQYVPLGYGSVKPVVSIFSPEDKTYNASSVPLTFTIDKPVSLIEYSLDGQDNVTVAGNITLTDLPNGAHSLTVYAKYAEGSIGASENISFSIDAPDPFPTVPVAFASGVSAIAIAAGLLIYFKKRKH